jgi:hypothetical protein
MGEQAPFLKYVTDAPFARRHVNTTIAIEQHASVDCDASTRGAQQPGDHIDQRGLTRAGAAK